VTAEGDRFQGRFHNDRFLNEQGFWVAPLTADQPLKA
jgi:hypothetical protein